MLEGLYVAKSSLRVETITLLQKIDDEFLRLGGGCRVWENVYIQTYTVLHGGGTQKETRR